MRVALFPKTKTHTGSRSETQPIRVCFVIDRLSRAGTETQLRALIDHLDREKVQPYLVLLDGEDSLSKELEPQNCPILRLGISSFASAKTPGAIWRLRQFWKAHRIDVVQTYFLDSSYFAIPLARICRIREVIRVRNNLGYWLTPRHRKLSRIVGRWAHTTLTNTTDGQAAIIQAEGLAPERVAVLENGVDLERFPVQEPPFAQGLPIRIGTVANLRPVKNIDGLIRVAEKVVEKFPHVVFSIAGDGEQRAALEQQIRERNLNVQVRLLGTTADIPGFLAQQDIAVLPSHSEGMSNSLLEYMASGRAIVATNVGANARLVRHEMEGLIVPPGSDDALYEAIASLIQAPAKACQLGRAARQQVEALYSRAQMIRRFEDFYASKMGR